MKVLITGASGFIGSHLAARFNSPTAIPHQKLSDPNLALTFDNFFFLSTYGNMVTHTDDKLIRQANIGDLLNVLNSIDPKKGFGSFVFVSSSSARLKRQTVYSRCKRAAEEMLLGYKEKYDLPICIVQPFSVTGVGEQKEHLIPKLIDSCLNGTPMDFVPQPVHDFIDVDDVVEGIINLSAHHAKGVFELGTGESHSNQEVREMVERVTGKKANITQVNSMRDYDNQEWISGNFRARMYGWLAKKTLEKSIQEMVEGANGKKKTA